ncbi:MAG TPA: hypothetical protein V6D14_30115 [Coleofasciculaceae cyanobacterium]
MAIVRGILGLCLVLVLFFWGGEAQAGQLADRLAQFPDWESKPPVTAAEGDLVYPAWMEGTWQVTSTLVDQVAPLAPEVVTPGFESNRRYLNQPISFLVRFQTVSPPSLGISDSASGAPWALRFVPLKTQGKNTITALTTIKTPVVVADRAFNGLNIAKAYLGDRTIQSVKVDPDSPNRQITSLRTGRQLTSIVTGRASETPSRDRFIATEVTNQVFRGTPQPYFNQVETTTAYQLVKSSSIAIEADQVTGIYLSPQDPDYFKALERPVALYRYQLKLLPVEWNQPTK